MRHLLVTTATALVLLLAGCPSFTSGDEPSFHPAKGSDTTTAQAQAPAPAPAPAHPQAQPPTPPPPAGANAGSPATIAARHILIMYKGAMRAPAKITRTKEQARARAEEVLKKAKAGSDFAALARQYSDGPSGPQGGDLGTFRHGQMVGPFDQAAFALSVGQISGIVETPFGFHIIKRYR